MSEGPSIPLFTVARGAAYISLAASIAVASWAAGEVGLSARRSRDAFVDRGGAIRSVACSADGRTIYLTAATGVIGSTDGAKTFFQVFPPPPPPQQQAAPAPAAPSAPAPHGDAPQSAGGTAGRQ